MLKDSIFNAQLENIFQTKEAFGLRGEKHIVNDMISKSEANLLYQIIVSEKPYRTLEVGLAHGVSALVFCQAHMENGIANSRHYAIDPNQFTTYGGAALKACQDAGLDNLMTILDGPSHMKIPELIKENVALDFAFIDGWHTFDYTMIDFFLIDKILKKGGYVAFHDVYGRAKQKVIDFIFTHRKYEIATEMKHMGKEPWSRTMKFFLWRIYKDPALLFSWYHWKFQFKNSSGLLILKKVEEFEPDFDFYKAF
jgi:predicted O-methyltransferase YrrM